MSGEIGSFDQILLNPTTLSITELSTYLQGLRNATRIPDEGGTQVYHGSADLMHLAQERVVGVGTLLRFWQTDLPEVVIVTRAGLLPHQRFGTPDQLIPPPFTRLDRNPATNRPYTWNIEGFELLTDEEIEMEINGGKNA